MGAIIQASPFASTEIAAEETGSLEVKHTHSSLQFDRASSVTDAAIHTQTRGKGPYLD